MDIKGKILGFKVEPEKLKEPITFQPSLVDGIGGYRRDFWEFQDKFLPPFRSTYENTYDNYNEILIVTKSARAAGANEKTMVAVGEKGLWYPANRPDFKNFKQAQLAPENKYIIAEVPNRDRNGSKRCFYQMLVEQNASVTFSATNYIKASGTMDFLNIGESLDLPVHRNGKLVQAKVICESEESLANGKIVSGDNKSNLKARKLVVSSIAGEQDKVIYQVFSEGETPAIVPTDIGYSTKVMRAFQKFISDKNIAITEAAPVVSCCNTGKDRSVFFVILSEILKDLQTLVLGKATSFEKAKSLLEQYDILSYVGDHACFMQNQIINGAGVDTFNNTKHKWEQGGFVEEFASYLSDAQSRESTKASNLQALMQKDIIYEYGKYPELYDIALYSSTLKGESYGSQFFSSIRKELKVMYEKNIKDISNLHLGICGFSLSPREGVAMELYFAKSSLRSIVEKLDGIILNDRDHISQDQWIRAKGEQERIVQSFLKSLKVLSIAADTSEISNIKFTEPGESRGKELFAISLSESEAQSFLKIVLREDLNEFRSKVKESKRSHV